MLFKTKIKKTLTPIAMLLLFAGNSFAQDTAKAAATNETGGSNLLAILLTVTTIVLAFVIWGMGQVLVAVSSQVIEKNKAVDTTSKMLLLLGFTMLTQISFAQEAVAELVKTEPNYGGLTANTFYAFVAVISIEVIAILFLAFSIHRIYQELLPDKIASISTTSKLSEWWSQFDKKFLTKAVAVEKEADILLDHDYDGIKELDNSLPPWWKYGFIATVIIAFVYMGYFHVLGAGKNPTEEYAAEIEKARVQKENFDANNKDKIDEINIQMTNASGITNGQEIFVSKCWPCHGKLGEGGAGPNLTDDYWLHGGSLTDIFHSIKTGYPDKGMQAWEKDMSPKEISNIASFIKTLHNSKPPNAKSFQGNYYSDEKQDSSMQNTKKDTIPSLTK